MTDEFLKLPEEELENVSGGVIRVLQNPRSKYSGVRETPGKDGLILGKLKNGTRLVLTGRTAKKDGYTWYEVTMETGSDYSWVPGYTLGL